MIGRIPSSSLLVFSLLGSAADAQPLPDRKTIQVRLQIPVDRIAPYEPVSLVVSLKNKLARPVELDFGVWGQLEFFIAQGDNKFTFAANSAEFALDVIRTFCIPPGEKAGKAQQLFLSSRFHEETSRYVFDQPGTYQIQARFIDGDKVLASEPVTLVVRAATLEERDAIPLLKDRIVTRMLQGGDQNARGLPLLEKLARSKTPYADYAAIRLGEYHFAQFAETFRPATAGDPVAAKRAYDYYALVTDRVPNLRAEALKMQASLITLSRGPKDRAVVTKLIREMEDHLKHAEAIGLDKDYANVLRSLKAIP